MTSLCQHLRLYVDRLLACDCRNPLKAGDGIHPKLIYEDRQDGFMMQYSAEGMWGRGLYFAHNARYSDNYAYLLRTTNMSLRFRNLSLILGPFMAYVLAGVGTALQMDRKHFCWRGYCR